QTHTHTQTHTDTHTHTVVSAERSGAERRAAGWLANVEHMMLLPPRSAPLPAMGCQSSLQHISPLSWSHSSDTHTHTEYEQFTHSELQCAELRLYMHYGMLPNPVGCLRGSLCG